MSEDVSKYSDRLYHVDKTLGRRKKDHNLGLHLKFYVLQMTLLIGLLIQHGWQLGGLQNLCQVLECCEEDSKTEHKNKISHTQGTGQMHNLRLKLE